MKYAGVPTILVLPFFQSIRENPCVTVFQVRKPPCFSHLAEVKISNTMVRSKSASSSFPKRKCE